MAGVSCRHACASKMLADGLTLKEIGEKYNLSRERIRQLQEQALGKIRRQIKE